MEMRIFGKLDSVPMSLTASQDLRTFLLSQAVVLRRGCFFTSCEDVCPHGQSVEFSELILSQGPVLLAGSGGKVVQSPGVELNVTVPTVS